MIRRARGKEDKLRLGERFGRASKVRPAGTLLWIHAASVGEANSILQLIAQMRERFSDVNILLTTGTVTSAKLMQTRLPAGVIHQYAPIDTPEATAHFLRHWKPDIGFWVESEFWPNLVMSARKRGCFMVVINGRMSERSYAGWQNYAMAMAYDMMSCFEVAFAQSEGDAQRLRALGIRDVRTLGNIKYDATVLPCDEAMLITLQNAIGNRPVWLAASTHPGEEILVAQAHATLAKKTPNLLTIIVPRHPARGASIAAALPKSALRSRGDIITADTSFYIADTLGELGLFYRLCEIVFLGGSLVPHGGQNPLEPARLRCAIICGTHTHNFAEIISEMKEINAVKIVENAASLANAVQHFMNNAEALATAQITTKEWLRDKGGATARIIDTLAPIFAPIEKKR